MNRSLPSRTLARSGILPNLSAGEWSGADSDCRDFQSLRHGSSHRRRYTLDHHSECPRLLRSQRVVEYLSSFDGRPSLRAEPSQNAELRNRSRGGGGGGEGMEMKEGMRCHLEVI